jgi:hypothetical protein
MPKSEFETLKKMIEQLGLEFQEFSTGIEAKFETISASLRSCQSHCYVKNPDEGPKT